MMPSWVIAALRLPEPPELKDADCDPRWFLVSTARSWHKARPRWDVDYDHGCAITFDGWTLAGPDGYRLDDVTHWAEAPELP